MTYDKGQLNGRPDGQNFAPIAPVGLYWDCRYAAGLAGRGHSWIRLAPTPAEQAAGVCASYHEFWARQFDPKYDWLCGDGMQRNGLAVIEAPHGTLGEWRRFQTIREREDAVRFGTPYLVDGFLEGASRYVEAGGEIVAHEGSTDEGAVARTTLEPGTPAARAELMRLIYEHDAPLVARNITIGHDFLSPFGPGSLSYNRWDQLRLLGARQQMEGSFGPDQVKDYFGAIVYMHWEAFNRYHVNQSPAVKASGAPAVGSREFATWYQEFRVVLPWDVAKKRVAPELLGQTSEYIAAAANVCRETLAKSANIRVLLSEWIVSGALTLGIPVERFLPEALK